MYGLPENCIINKPLYKKAVFEKFNLKSAERDRFDADISKIAIVAYVSPSKIPALHEGQEVTDISKIAIVAYVSPSKIPALHEGQEVKEFYVLQIQLKHRDYDSKNILMLNKLIPQKMVFALEFDDNIQLCIFHTRLQQSEWVHASDAIIPIKGLSLDDVWNNIVAEIGGLSNDAEETLEQQIIGREEREKLLKQIEVLEKRCRLEKQTRKKYELHQQLLKLKEKLKYE